MSTEHVNALRSVRPDLLKSVHMGEGLLSVLLSDFVITKAVKEEIEVSNSWCRLANSAFGHSGLPPIPSPTLPPFPAPLPPSISPGGPTPKPVRVSGGAL